MKKITLLFISLFAGQLAQAQVGAMFPALTGTTLEDKSVSLPKDTKGKFTLVGVAYSQKAEDVLKKWFQPVYSTFIDQSDYEVNTYFVPMIGGIKEMAAGAIEKRMKKGIDPKLHKHTLLYTGEVASYKKALGLNAKDTPYFFVIDKEGKIIYATSGEYSDDKISAVEEIVDDSWEEK